jgi:hypothetical protein
MNKIEVREIVLGVHNWSNCPHKEVDFLTYPHHHDFVIRVSCEVDHNDRDVEFIMLRIWVKKFIKNRYNIKDEIVYFGSRSCEMISDDITKGLIETYGEKKWKVNVSEDDIQRGGQW